MNKFAIVGIIPIIVSFFFISSGFSSMQDTREFLDSANTTTGTVIGLKKYAKDTSRRTRRNNATTYSVIFTFEDDLGDSYTVESENRTNVFLPKVGEEVEIFYLPLNPEDAKINSFLHTWFTSLAYFTFAAAFIYLGGAIAFVKPKKKD